MKLYTEEQVRWAFRNGHIYAHLNEVDENEFIGELVPITLPTDEEIELKSVEYSTDPETKEFYKDCCWDFQNGVKWVIDKIEGGIK